MTGAEGLKVWIHTLLSYDKYGNATILKSFMNPAKDSTIKGKKRAKFNPKINDNTTISSEDIW